MEHVMRHGNPAGVPNIHTEKRYSYPELARKTGLSSLLSVPLISLGKVIGSINIYTSDERVFSDVEIGFVKVVAGQAAIAIQNARLMAEMLEIKHLLEDRRIIDRAKAILQHKHHFTEEEAYLRLRNQSRKLRRSMRELAEAVILADDLNGQNNPERYLKIGEGLKLEEMLKVEEGNEAPGSPDPPALALAQKAQVAVPTGGLH